MTSGSHFKISVLAGLLSAAVCLMPANAGGPAIDEFSAIMNDLADDGQLEVSAGPHLLATLGISSQALEDEHLRAQLHLELDQVLEARIKVLEQAEQALRAAAEMRHASIEEIHMAIEHALSLKETALTAALSAVEDVEIRLKDMPAPKMLAALQEWRVQLDHSAGRIEDALRHIYQERGDEICTESAG